MERNLLQVPEDWEKENTLINQNNLNKIIRNENFIWESKRHRVSKEKTSKRILVLGDSYVWGDGYANMNHTWWRQLGRELILRGYKDIEVIGAGFCGASTRDELQILKKTYSEYKPDLIVWGYVANDPDEKIIKKKYRPEEELSEINIWALKIYEVMKKIISYVSPRFIEHLERIYKVHAYENWQHKLLLTENMGMYEKTLNEIREFQKTNNIPMFFITLPNVPYKERFQNLYNPVKEIFFKRGLPFYDILSDISAHYKNDSRPKLSWGINPANSHPSPLLSRYFAKKAADIIESDFKTALPEKQEIHSYNIININDTFPENLKISSEGKKLIINYPEETNTLRKLPYNKPYIQLNLEMPVILRGILIRGGEINKLTVYLVNSDYENTERIKIIDSNKPPFTWNDNLFSKEIEEIHISADFKGRNREIVVEFTTDDLTINTNPTH
ncbi:MAG: SGNH/GDSL hydrolase family protein [Deltaproteobacteria bacterium]|nr:SGNH/GDSL hydrolase family protein [Deltaproteobacteria bacterium]